MVTMDVWPGLAPGDCWAGGEEMFRPPWAKEAEGTQWLTNVSRPTLTLYRPMRSRETGAAVVICPGGGYWNLAWDLEGEEVAAWLNSIGITGILLKYRVPRRPGEPEALPAAGPLQDAQRTMSLVRSKAAEWELDPERIGMIGFSAGAHLALAAATNFDRRAYEMIDDVDRTSSRPDFVISLYPGYLAENGTLAPYMQIVEATPAVFLVHAGDDDISDVENSVVMYLALKRAGIPAELHVYGAGGHGFGVRPSHYPISGWTERCAGWLRERGVLR